MPSCFRLLRHCARLAASRAAWTAGSKSAISTAIMAMTTSSSIRVNPLLAELRNELLLGMIYSDGSGRRGLLVIAAESGWHRAKTRETRAACRRRVVGGRTALLGWSFLDRLRSVVDLVFDPDGILVEVDGGRGRWPTTAEAPGAEDHDGDRAEAASAPSDDAQV